MLVHKKLNGNLKFVFTTKVGLPSLLNWINVFVKKNNLDEYIEFVRAQEKKGTNCPVLYLQEEVNTQGENVYRMRPSPFDLQGGLSATNENSKVIEISDARRMNYPYNQNNYPGFDPEGQYIGVYTNLDAVHDSTMFTVTSDNPMDPNWGGQDFTQALVDAGYYKGSEVQLRV